MLEDKWTTKKMSYTFHRFSRVCSKCALLVDDDDKMKCFHNSHFCPYFKPERRHNLLGELYSAVNAEEDFKVEMLSFNEKIRTCYFHVPDILSAIVQTSHSDFKYMVGRDDHGNEVKGFFTSKSEKFNIGIDPSGGADSLLAMTITSYNKMARATIVSPLIILVPDTFQFLSYFFFVFFKSGIIVIIILVFWFFFFFSVFFLVFFTQSVVF